MAGMATKRRGKTTTAVATVNGRGGGNLCEMHEIGKMTERGAGLLYNLCESSSVQRYMG